MEVKSKPSLKSSDLPKIFLVFSIFSLFTFHFSLSTFQSLCYALDEGGATAGMEYRSLNLESSTTKTNQFEAISHLDVWQNLPNAGKLFLWLDWADANNDEKINRLGRGFLALREYRFNDYILNGLIGDSSIIFANLPEKFLNSTYPDVYFRGFQTDLLAKWGMVQVFGGKVARLEGLLGKTYDITDEVLYGFKGNFEPIPRLLLGTGFIRTQDEADNNDQPVTKNNNLLLFDSKFKIFNWMKWLTDFRRSDFKGEPGIESQNDYMLRFGPMIESETFRLEANYRRIGTDYRFVNQATQGESDQEGFFSLPNISPGRSLPTLEM